MKVIHKKFRCAGKSKASPPADLIMVVLSKNHLAWQVNFRAFGLPLGSEPVPSALCVRTFEGRALISGGDRLNKAVQIQTQ